MSKKINSKAIDDSLDVTGMVIDCFLQAKGLPPIAALSLKSAKSAYNYTLHLKEKSFNAKLSNFLAETGTVSDQDRLDFMRLLGKDTKEFWERILLLMEEIDDERKSTICGKLCTALILKQLSIDQFFRLGLIVKQSYIKDLDYLYADNFKKLEPIASTEVQSELEKINWIRVRYKLVHMDLLNTNATPTQWGKLLLYYGF